MDKMVLSLITKITLCRLLVSLNLLQHFSGETFYMHRITTKHNGTPNMWRVSRIKWQENYIFLCKFIEKYIYLFIYAANADMFCELLETAKYNNISYKISFNLYKRMRRISSTHWQSEARDYYYCDTFSYEAVCTSLITKHRSHIIFL
jgi:hypothetical protein